MAVPARCGGAGVPTTCGGGGARAGGVGDTARRGFARCLCGFRDGVRDERFGFWCRRTAFTSCAGARGRCGACFTSGVAVSRGNAGGDPAMRGHATATTNPAATAAASATFPQ